MDWRRKAGVQRVLGRAPGGRHLNFLLQRFVTHTYPRRRRRLAEVVDTAARHRREIERFVPRPLSQVSTLEFGAGWDLATPLALAGQGIGHQLLVDIERVARPSLVRGVIADLQAGGHLPARAASGRTVEQLVEPFGIEYRAPADARATGLADGSIDAALSTSTLEHISPDDIAAILDELHRVLRPDGICSFAIDYHDHFAGADPSIHALNFLRFTEDEWQRWNCPMQFQNRLRHPDYLALIAAAGFAVLDVEAVVDPSLPTEIELAPEFRHHRPDDLRITDGWFVLRPT